MSNAIANPPRFSIVIPAHRAGRYIQATLATVARQTESSWEILVGEDGVLDDTAEKVRAFAATVTQPVRLFSEPINRGVSLTRNALLAAATGEYIAFLDADDLWDDDHLSSAVATFAAGADVAFSGVTFLDENSTPLPGRFEPSADQLANIASAMFRHNFVQCASALCVRRRALADAGGFDASLSHGEDLDLWLRLLVNGAVWRYTGRTSCAYRKHGTSAMAQTRLASTRLTAFYEKQLNNPLLPLAERRAALIANLIVNARLNWRDHPEVALAALRRWQQLQPLNPTAFVGRIFLSTRQRLAPRRPLAPS